WYSDPEVARLARYQDGPMRADEIDRFFQLRALGAESLTMAIHERHTGRLIGSCALSQVDGENGSAMYHITIGEKDAWGHGYGTQATQLMVDTPSGRPASPGSGRPSSRFTGPGSGRIGASGSPSRGGPAHPTGATGPGRPRW